MWWLFITWSPTYLRSFSLFEFNTIQLKVTLSLYRVWLLFSGGANFSSTGNERGLFVFALTYSRTRLKISSPIVSVLHGTNDDCLSVTPCLICDLNIKICIFLFLLSPVLISVPHVSCRLCHSNSLWKLHVHLWHRGESLVRVLRGSVLHFADLHRECEDVPLKTLGTEILPTPIIHLKLVGLISFTLLLLI